MKPDTLLKNSLGACGTYCRKLHNHPKQEASLSAQVSEFFSKLFDTDDSSARWNCGTWTGFHGWLYIISDLLIWASYFAIPFLLLQLMRKRNDLPFHKIFVLFVAFILLCGTTHLIDAGIFWWPVYRFSALVRFATAMVSVFTVYALSKVVPLAFNLRTVRDLEAEMEKRRSVEERLAASEYLLSETSRISRVGGWETDLKTNHNTWSKTVYDIFEIPYDFDLRNFNLSDYFFGKYLNQLEEAIADAHLGKKKWDFELQLMNAKGITLWIRSTGEPVVDEQENVIKLRGIVMDIDRYKQTETALNKSLELTTLHNQQLKNFTHILSHNIRNHASNMALISSLVDEDKLDADNKELFGKLNAVSTALNATLEDLSEAIRIKDAVIRREILNFGDELDKVVNIFRSDLSFKHAQLDVQLDVKTISFPRIYLQSILTNLISNAVKYRRANVTPVILIKTYQNPAYETVLECIDNGLGIDMRLHHKKIFGLYKTFHDRKDAYGVGLFLVKTQVESQGGRIEVESMPNQGSTFRITF